MFVVANLKAESPVVRLPLNTVAPATAKLVREPTEVIAVWAAVVRVPPKLVADIVVRPLTTLGRPTVTVPPD